MRLTGPPGSCWPLAVDYYGPSEQPLRAGTPAATTSHWTSGRPIVGAGRLCPRKHPSDAEPDGSTGLGRAPVPARTPHPEIEGRIPSRRPP